MRKSLTVLVCLLVNLAFAAIPHISERSVTQVADGVYVIIHKDVSDSWPQGNTVVVVGDRGVFVVDSCLLTAAAKEDIADIRRITPKPVRYLLNTHWHIDHNAGNSAYMEAFAGLDIISHSATRQAMDAINPRVAGSWAAPGGNLAQEIAGQKAMLATGKGEDGKALSASDKAQLPEQIADRERQMADYKTYKYQPPSLLFERGLTLDLGNREVRIKNLGRAATSGDAFVYLPREKVLITGDLLVSPVPYAGNSYPAEWAETLRAMAAMDADIIVPGHGPVERDKKYMNEVIELLDSVVKQVRAATPKATKVEDLHIDIERFRKSMAGDDAEKKMWFEDQTETPLIQRAFDQARDR